MTDTDPADAPVTLPPSLIVMMADTGFFTGDVLSVERRVRLCEASLGRVQPSTAKDYVRYLLDFYTWLHARRIMIPCRDTWALDQAVASHLVDLTDADAPQRAMRNTRAALQALHCLPNGALSSALTAERALGKRVSPAKETRPLPRLLVRAVAAHWLLQGGALRRRAAWWLLLLFGTMSRSAEFARLCSVDILVSSIDDSVAIRLFDLKTLVHQQRHKVVVGHKASRTVHVAVVGQIERAAARLAAQQVDPGHTVLPVTMATVRQWLTASLHALDLPQAFYDLGPFVPYGTRHGACTEARLAGCSIEQVMRRAEWVTGSSVNVYTHFDLAAEINTALRPAHARLVHLVARLGHTLGLADAQRIASLRFPPEIVANAAATRVVAARVQITDDPSENDVTSRAGPCPADSNSDSDEDDAFASYEVDEIWFDDELTDSDVVVVVWSGSRQVTYEPVAEVHHLDAFAKALFDTLPFSEA